MYNDKTARNPLSRLRIRDHGSLASAFERRWIFMLRRLGSQSVASVPHILGRIRCSAGKIGTGFVYHGQFQALRVGLLGAGHRNVHPIFLAILV